MTDERPNHADQRFVERLRAAREIPTELDEVAKETYDANRDKVVGCVIGAFSKKKEGKRSPGPLEARGLFHDSFVIFYKNTMNKPEFRLTASLSTYLCQICKNQWSYWNSQSVSEKLKLQEEALRLDAELKAERSKSPDFEPTPGTEAEEQFQRIERMKAALKQLDKACSDLLRLFFYDRMNGVKVAEKMQIQYYTAQKRRQRCLLRLKDVFGTAPGSGEMEVGV